MQNINSLNDIADEFNIKPPTLSIFQLEELYTLGKSFERLTERPKVPPCSGSYDIVFDLGNESFCSIFLAIPDGAKTTELDNTILSEGQIDTKLISDLEILSSEFECDDAPSILTSETHQGEVN